MPSKFMLKNKFGDSRSGDKFPNVIFESGSNVWWIMALVSFNITDEQPSCTSCGGGFICSASKCSCSTFFDKWSAGKNNVFFSSRNMKMKLFLWFYHCSSSVDRSWLKQTFHRHLWKIFSPVFAISHVCFEVNEDDGYWIVIKFNLNEWSKNGFS